MSEVSKTKDPNKDSQSKSKSRRQKKSKGGASSNVSDEKMERQIVVMPELGKKLRLMNVDQNDNGPTSTRHDLPSRRRSQQRSSSRHSAEVPPSVSMTKLESKMERSQRQSGFSSPSADSEGRRRRHSHRNSSPNHGGGTSRRGHRSRRSYKRRSSHDSSALKSTMGSDSGDDTTAELTLSFNSRSIHDLASIAPDSASQESSQDITVDPLPGAFRVSSEGEVSVPCSSADGLFDGDDEDIDIQTNSISAGTFWSTSDTITMSTSYGERSRSGTITAHSRSNNPRTGSRSILRSVSEEHGIMLEAMVARDYGDELKEARQRGREEALEEVIGSRHRTAEIAVAMPSDNGNHDEDEDGGKGNKRNTFCLALICLGILITAVCVSIAMLLLGSKPEVSSQLDENEESNAKVVVVYTPPTQEECEAIATGIILDDQLSLVHKSFYIHYDITLASDEDLAPLFNAMMRHIQENLIPIMAGCGATDFLGTPIALDDGLKNATNAIVNGKVAKESEASCSSDGSSDNCRSYVLLLDLYLNEEKTSSSLIEVIRDSVNGEELAEALGFQFPGVDMEVNVPLIVSTIDATVVPSTSYDLMTAVPTEAPTPHPHKFEPSRFVSRTVSPTMGLPVTSPGTTSSPSMMPISPSLLSFEPTKGNGSTQIVTPSPTDNLSNTVTTRSTRSPTPFPTPLPTPLPTSLPTPSTTLVGSNPTKAPTRHPTRSPTRSPTLSPSMMFRTPTPEISKSPTESPSSSPSLISTPAPTKTPSLAPTNVPSSIPSKLPISAPSVFPSSLPSVFPSKAPTKSPTLAPTTTAGGGTWCCSNSLTTCDVAAGSCNVNQFACEDSCLGTWIQENSCTGLARWSECTNDVTGCCAPAVCTNQGPSYKQCI
ncbi:unnamed protein product [Cylindrotheca closterium]|uniref:Uncharacterized protein n=1 Tax=Cylindrotheca closterium TaxID=2856 RepID=A0AAD2PVS4_9STRA|nr:unnamed protein product [Cylindrotheca closterium]